MAFKAFTFHTFENDILKVFLFIVVLGQLYHKLFIMAFRYFSCTEHAHFFLCLLVAFIYALNQVIIYYLFAVGIAETKARVRLYIITDLAISTCAFMLLILLK